MGKNTIVSENEVENAPITEGADVGLSWLERYNNGDISDEEVEKLDERLREQESNVCYAAQLHKSNE